MAILGLVTVLAAASASRPASAYSVLRGGLVSVRTPTDTQATEAHAGTKHTEDVTVKEDAVALKEYVSALEEFMGTFESTLQMASRRCKPYGPFGLSASPSRVRQRPDRKALQTAHHQLSELYASTIADANIDRLPYFAAESLRLQTLLTRLFREVSGPPPPAVPTLHICTRRNRLLRLTAK